MDVEGVEEVIPDAEIIDVGLPGVIESPFNAFVGTVRLCSVVFMRGNTSC